MNRNKLGESTKVEYGFRLYLNSNQKRVFGKGGAQILEAIDECGSINGAADELGMSFKFVRDYLARMRKILRKPIVVTYRGGRSGRRIGGGGATLTPFARNMLKEFRSTETSLEAFLAKRQAHVFLTNKTSKN